MGYIPSITEGLGEGYGIVERAGCNAERDVVR